MLKNCRQMLRHACGGLLSAIFLCLCVNRADASEQADSAGNRKFTEPVMASVLVAGPGDLIYQTTGHAAIRLQCPAFRLDNVFTYETNSENLLLQILGGTRGRYSRVALQEYLSIYRAEGREVKEFPLNLTDSEIRRLWQLLDELVANRTEGDFNVRWTNCNSKAMEPVVDILHPSRIVMNRGSDVRFMDNGDALRAIFLPDSPWSAFLYVTALGKDADDTDSWETRMFPVTMESHFSDAEIEAEDSGRRPFLAGTPRVLVKGAPQKGAPFLTPAMLCAVILLFAIILSALDMAGRGRRFVRVSDRVLLGLETLASLLLIAAAIVPASIGGAWNWLFIPLNPLPLVFLLLFRRRPVCRRFFIAYGGACLLFTLAPFVTSGAHLWSSLLSGAIGIRVLTHYLIKTTKKPQK